MHAAAAVHAASVGSVRTYHVRAGYSCAHYVDGASALCACMLAVIRDVECRRQRGSGLAGKRGAETKHPLLRCRPLPPLHRYDLLTDPIERYNLAAPGYKRTLAQEIEYQRLKMKLFVATTTRLRPLPGTQVAVALTATSTSTTPKPGPTSTLFLQVTGPAAGQPLGSGNLALTTPNLVNPLGLRASLLPFIFTSDIGDIRGTALTRASAANGVTTLQGSATIKAGSGAMAGLKAQGLQFVYTYTTDAQGAQSGSVSLTGTAAYV